MVVKIQGQIKMIQTNIQHVDNEMILGIKNFFNIFWNPPNMPPKKQPGPWPIVFLFSVSF